MLALALPSLRAVWTPVDSSVIPKGQSARTVADTLTRDFGGQDTSPITVVLSGDEAAAYEPRHDARARPGVRAVAEPRELDASTWQVDVVAAGEPEGETARGARAGHPLRAQPGTGRRRRRGVHRPAGRDRLEPPARRRAAGAR